MKGRMIRGGVGGFVAGFLGACFTPLLYVGVFVIAIAGTAMVAEMMHSKSPTNGRGYEGWLVGGGFFLVGVRLGELIYPR